MNELINDTNYRSFPAVSNSDLTELQKYWMPENKFMDVKKAYANGTLIDAMTRRDITRERQDALAKIPFDQLPIARIQFDQECPGSKFF